MKLMKQREYFRMMCENKSSLSRLAAEHAIKYMMPKPQILPKKMHSGLLPHMSQMWGTTWQMNTQQCSR